VRGTRGPELGTSIADLAEAVAGIPGTELVTEPVDVTVGGYPAKHVAISIPSDIGCAVNDFDLWYAPAPDHDRYATETGETIQTWIIDVGGTPVWIDAETFLGAGPEPGTQVQQIIDSIQFDKYG
jgi:hypothetical protein